MTLGKSSYLPLQESYLNFIKSGWKNMDYSILSIISRSEGRNNDTWNSVQVRSFEPVHNQTIVWDWTWIYLEESKFSLTCGIGKKTRRATTTPNFRPWRSEFIEIQHIQYQAHTKQEKCVYFFKICLSFVWKIILKWFEGHNEV